ncbi:MAG: RES family NAD+ phosphorylase [Ectothiorhodospiraceae bacterium]|nr:RES family NAD+ phosphorylase [Ectothiorhodospiraceae bacterium]
MKTPTTIALDWRYQYRVIASEFPPINFFESLVDADLMDELYYIESLTNDRLRDQVGDITLVAPEDRLCGPGSSPVMAAFTHVSPACPSRFSDGSYGVYYASKTLNTAIEETTFHRTLFLAYTQEDPGEIDMRVYIGEVTQSMHDIRDEVYEKYHIPNNWTPSQDFGRDLRMDNAWGIVYRSVRDPNGECIAVLRPSALTIPRQAQHLSYVWDGESISNVYEKTLLL